MSLRDFDPTLWEAAALVNLHKAQVAGQKGIIGRNYEGAVKYGQAVKVNNYGPVSVRKYVPDTDMVGPDAILSGQQLLVVNQRDYVNFAIDDVDQAQATGDLMGGAMFEAGYSVSDTADQFILSQYPYAGNLIGSDGAPVTPTSNTAGTSMYDYIIQARTALNKANVPALGRWMIVPPEAGALLLLDDRFVKYTEWGTLNIQQGNVGNGNHFIPTDPDSGEVLNGFLGRIGGFMVFESNNVQVVSDNFKILAGHELAWDYADGMAEYVAYIPEKRMAEAIKGLHLYGAHVFRPRALVCITATIS